MSKQQVKLSFDGSVRKVMMDVGSYALIQQSVSNVIGLPVGEFTVSYVDDDKDVISFPTIGVTKDEFDAFKTVQGPIRLIIERVVKANQTSTTVKDDVTAPSSTSVETAPSAPPAVEASASTSAAVEEEEEEPPKKEKSLCSLIGTILSNENIVHDVQNAIASKQVADIAALIGAALVAAGDDGEEEGCSFTSLVPILFTQAPVLLDILHQLSEKHPEIKELVETVKEQGCCSFAHPRMYRRFFKICKRGGFGCHNEEQGDDNAGHHHRRCHRQDDNTAKPIHYGVTCDGCSSNNELKEKSITEGHFAQHRGGFIAGNRYNSASVYNFDLCESCEASGLFQQTHGPFVKIQKRNHGGCRRRRGNPFDVFGFHTAAAAASSCDNTQDDDVEQIYAQSSASKPCFEQKKSKKEEFENIQKQGMELFSSIMKAVNESSQPKKENTEKDIDALAEKWKSKIELLQSLGFVEWKRYLPILEEENGDLERCIGRILALHDA